MANMVEAKLLSSSEQHALSEGESYSVCKRDFFIIIFLSHICFYFVVLSSFWSSLCGSHNSILLPSTSIMCINLPKS